MNVLIGWQRNEIIEFEKTESLEILFVEQQHVFGLILLLLLFIQQ